MKIIFIFIIALLINGCTNTRKEAPPDNDLVKNIFAMGLESTQLTSIIYKYYADNKKWPENKDDIVKYAQANSLNFPEKLYCRIKIKPSSDKNIEIYASMRYMLKIK